MGHNPYINATERFNSIKYFDKKTNEPVNIPSGNSAGDSSVEKMFNDKGEMNACSKKEALENSLRLLNATASGKVQAYKTANTEYTDDEASSIIREAFSDPSSEGFKMVGQGILNPIKEVIDFEGLARKVLSPRAVKSGEVVRYDKDVYVNGFVIAEDGQTPVSMVEGHYAYPPEFEVTTYPSIEIKDQFRAQYDIIARIQQKAKMAIEYQEDLALVNLLQAAAPKSNATSVFATLNLAAFEAIRYQVERHRLTLSKFIMHRQEVSDIVTSLSALVDPMTQREIIMSGYIGNLLNAQIITTAGTFTYEILQPGEVIGVADAEYLGAMPIRVELMSEPTQPMVNGQPRKGWFFYELISMYVGNTAAVALGQKV